LSVQGDEAAGPLGAFRGVSSAGQWRVVGRRFRRRRMAMAGLVVLAVLGLSAVFAPLLTPYDVDPLLSGEVLSQARQPPSQHHPFGTDELGRDQLTRVLYGGRVSLLIGLCVAVASSVIGTTVGAVAGYFGGRVDQLLMRLVDLLLVLPGTALLMIAQRGLGSSLTVIILVLAGLFWRVMSRMVRSVFVSLKEQEFVEAARASGASSARIIVSEMLPAVVGPVCVHLTLAAGAAILAESALSFLGFGIQAPAVSWGNMLNQSRGAVGTSLSYLVYAPGLAILVTVLAVNFVGNGLRDALDPHTPA
jgi:peptide/nickel transport system permease protein